MNMKIIKKYQAFNEIAPIVSVQLFMHDSAPKT